MKTVAFSVALATMFLFGAFDITRGVAAPFMKSDWQLTYFQLGSAFAANSLGYVFGSFAAGFAVQRMGLRKLIVSGGSLLLAGLAVFLISRSYTAVLLGFLVYGFGGGSLEIGVNGVVPVLASSERESSGYFNTLHGLYGLGAFGFPALAVWFINVLGGWRGLYVVLAVCLFAVLAVAWFHPTPVLGHRGSASTPSPAPIPPSYGTKQNVYKNPLLYVLLTAISAYVMAEAAVAGWLPTYLVQVRQLSVGQSTLYLSGFYLAFTAGRLSAPLWISKLGNYPAIGISTIVALVTVGMALASPSLLPFFVLAGAGFAVVFPTIASVASQAFQHQAGTVLGFLFTAAGIGTMVLNAFIGWMASTYGLSVGFSFVMLFLAVVLVSTWMAQWLSRQPVVYEQSTWR